MKETVLAGLRTAVIDGDTDRCTAYAKDAVALGVDAYEVVRCCSEGMGVVGERYEEQEYFIPELMLGAEAMNAAIAVLRPHMLDSRASGDSPGKVVLGVVEGDVHDIGKNVVRMVLEAEGFEVFDVGYNAPMEVFIDKVRETRADLIGLSTFITTTLPMMEGLIRRLREIGVRDEVKVMVGGAATSEAFAAAIGADGWAKNAIEAARKMRELLS
jgi:methylmalonyl-CoA mutase cobalamin-binding domain/chain